jgi:hypothetical protein
MRRSNLLVLLAVLLTLMNGVWILATIKSQDIVALMYNIVTVSLNIVFMILSALPEED